MRGGTQRVLSFGRVGEGVVDTSCEGPGARGLSDEKTVERRGEKLQARPVCSKRKGRRGVFVHRKALNGRRCVGASLTTPFEARHPIQTVLSDVAVVVAG